MCLFLLHGAFGKLRFLHLGLQKNIASLATVPVMVQTVLESIDSRSVDVNPPLARPPSIATASYGGWADYYNRTIAPHSKRTVSKQGWDVFHANTRLPYAAKLHSQITERFKDSEIFSNMALFDPEWNYGNDAGADMRMLAGLVSHYAEGKTTSVTGLPDKYQGPVWTKQLRNV